MKEELEELGVIIIKDEEVEGTHFLGMEFDLDTTVDYSTIISEDFTLKKLTGRKDFFYVKFVSYDKELQRLTVSVTSPVTEDVYQYYKTAYKSMRILIATNFPDLCWYHADGTTELTVNEVETVMRKESEMGDLTWFMPSRMVDNFIEIMHTLNQSMLEGLMQDTICYGPTFIRH